MVSLQTLSFASGNRKYVHVENSIFIITSDHPVADVSVWPVMTRRMPGRVGSYLLPSDSVISFRSETTSVAAVKSFLETEMSLSERQGLFHPVPVVPHGTEHIEEGAEEEEEDDEYAILPNDEDCDDDKDDQEEIQEEVHEEVQEEVQEEDIPEWGDDQNPFLSIREERHASYKI